MKTKLLTIAEKYHYNWEVILENNPDKVIANSESVAITSDAWILDRASIWFNLIAELLPKNYKTLVSC